jgi:predicted nucleic acid-binding protein
MPSVVIADASPLILLHKIDELNLLKRVYGSLITTPEIALEFGFDLPNWIFIKPVTDKKYQALLATQVDSGEASAIALATEQPNALLVLDDLKARKLAHKLNLKITGTLGVIHKAKQLSVIPKVKPILDKLLLTDFHVNERIIDELLKLNGED